MNETFEPHVPHKYTGPERRAFVKKKPYTGPERRKPGSGRLSSYPGPRRKIVGDVVSRVVVLSVVVGVVLATTFAVYAIYRMP